MPHEDAHEVFETCMLMMKLWFTLNTSNKNLISTFDFEKLAQYPFIKEIGLKKADLSLTFQYVSQNEKHVSFILFCEVMLHFNYTKVNKQMSLKELL